jgi:hypothetical protein
MTTLPWTELFVAFTVTGVVIFLLTRKDGIARHPPYRSVVRRTQAKDGSGELVELECGHAFIITHVPRASLPCDACADEAKRQK